jgi:hypothetical protein
LMICSLVWMTVLTAVVVYVVGSIAAEQTFWR